MCILQLRANALIKRGSMYMQQQQPMLSTQDFNMAAEIDPGNPDVFHHRGQVLTKLVSRCCFDLIRERALVNCSVFIVYSSSPPTPTTVAENSAGSGGRGCWRL